MTGDAIRSLRVRLQLAPQQLAELLGASISTVYRWEAAGPVEVAIDPFQLRILGLLREQMAAADAQRQNDVAEGIAKGLLIGGGLLGLYHLLDAVFGEQAGGRRSGGAVAGAKVARARSSPTTGRKKGGGKR